MRQVTTVYPFHQQKSKSLLLGPVQMKTQGRHTCFLWCSVSGHHSQCWGCLAWGFCGTPNSESKAVSGSFACSWEPFLPHTRLRRPGLIQGCLILLHCFMPWWSVPLGDLLFSKGNKRNSGFGRDAEDGGLGEGETVIWDVLYEKRIRKNNNNKNQSNPPNPPQFATYFQNTIENFASAFRTYAQQANLPPSLPFFLLSFSSSDRVSCSFRFISNLLLSWGLTLNSWSSSSSS